MEDGIKISERELRGIDNQISAAKSLMGITDTCKIPFVISCDEFNIAAYNPRTDVIFIDPRFGDRQVPKEMLERFVCPDHKLSALVHELFHWRDAYEYREKGRVIKDPGTLHDYTIHQRKLADIILRLIRFDLDDMNKTKREVSEYAYDAQCDNDFEELLTEVRTKQLLGGWGMHAIIPKEVRDALDACTPYLIYSVEVGEYVLKDDTPQEIRELHEETHKRMQRLIRPWLDWDTQEE